MLSMIFLFAPSLPLVAGEPSISIVERSSRGESKTLATVRADDGSVRKEILDLWKEAKDAFPENRRNLYGPDSGFVAIELTDGEETMVIRSWHPLFADDPELVVTSRGVEPLKGRNRDEVLKADEEWYRDARRVFDKIVDYAEGEAEKKESHSRFPAPGFIPSREESPSRLAVGVEKERVLAVKDASPDLERAAVELERVRKLADANRISRQELLQAEEKEALLRAKEEGSPAPAIAAIKVRFARERLKMKQALFDAGAIPQAEFDAAQSELESAETEFGKALNKVEPKEPE